MTGVLQRFVNIREEEVGPVLASMLFYFCVLSALMVIRPARESLGMEQGLDTVRWLFMGTAIVTLLVNPVFGWLVSRFRRIVFINATYIFFATSLVGFYFALVFAPDAIGNISGRIFYVWFSVFNLFVNMVFWGLMADRFSLEQSKRLFGAIAAGGTVGAIVGPLLAGQLAEPFGTPFLLLAGVGFLIAATGAAALVSRTQPGSVKATATATAGETDKESVEERQVIGGSPLNGLKTAVSTPYFLGISVYVLIAAIFATYLYFTQLQIVAGMAEGVDQQTTIFANVNLYTQIATLILQLLVAGHIMRWVGVPIALVLLPVTTALGFLGLAVTASFATIVLAQAAYNSVQRAIMRPARETLFTVVNREDKYKAKAFIDTFVYRGGDVLGSQTEGWLGRLGMGLTALISVAVPLALVWGVLGLWLGKAQQRKARAVNGGVETLDPTAAASPAR